MAKKDVVQYFLEIEAQYLEMLDNLKEFKELAAQNRISQADLEMMTNEIATIKTNYERIAYIMFLLNKPQRKDKKLDDVTLGWYKALHTASKEALIDENKDALCTLKQLIREGKIGNEE